MNRSLFTNHRKYSECSTGKKHFIIRKMIGNVATKERKERTQKFKQQGGEGGDYSKKSQVLVSPHSPAITAADR